MGCVSDPLPTALQSALPLYQGESGFTVPLRQGDKHERSASPLGRSINKLRECRGSLTHQVESLYSGANARSTFPDI